MRYSDIVKKLIGPIEPVGETNEDEKRFKNLEDLCELVDRLIYDIDNVTRNRTSPRYSEKRAGVYADDFLTKLGIDM